MVVNPKGRHRAERARAELALQLIAAGLPPATVLETTVEHPGATQARALLGDRVDLVLVAGGDGTVREVVSELSGTGTALGVVPTGTANLFARNLGLSRRDVRGAVRTALTGHDAVLDVGEVQVRTVQDPQHWQGPLHFLVMAGIGRDAQAVAATGIWIKRIFGWVGYFLAGAGHALLRGLPMVVDLDGEPRPTRTWTVLFGNNAQIPGHIVVFPDARPDDGELVALQVPLRSPADWLMVAAKGLVGRPAEARALEYRRTTRARVTPQRPMPVQLDGDVVRDVIDLQVGIEAGALLVRVPGALDAGRRRGAPGAVRTIPKLRRVRRGSR